MLKKLVVGATVSGILVSGATGVMAAETKADSHYSISANLIQQNMQESMAYTTVTVLGDKAYFSVDGLQHYFSSYTSIFWQSENGKILSVAYPTDGFNQKTSATEHYAKAERNLSAVREFMPSGTYVTAYAEINGEKWPVQSYYIEY
ncbi:hypothetical protein [Bacillus sp. FDAARGOS_1420]|uniref:hypothetical protein n=1 Tax=Bacillus sp. FDAARGOS_1420 TaxID=2856338 RepID=UPI001C5B8ED8|nr:hypothetical protein [Bacillus sp. FDAARGOS_1420]MBW3496878.1 hypothetical protein [Bacillus sp. FDAARGOS_1420]